MAMLVLDPRLEERVKAQRQAWDVDHYDEVWEGVYVVTPAPTDEHQEIVSHLTGILEAAVAWPGLGQVRPGVNLTGREHDWEHDYRIPDVAVFLKGGKAVNHGTHWRGSADFLVEITSPHDRTWEKIPFYSGLAVVELLIVDREAWRLVLYRHREGQLAEVGQSRLDAPDVLRSQSVPLTFQLVPGDRRPQIQVVHVGSGRQWLI